MAKRSRKRTQKAKKRGRSKTKAGSSTSPPVPDWRVIEGNMWAPFRALGGGGDDAPLAQAQEIMYQAFEAEDAQQRVQLAQKALAISPDCADAYVLLAEHTSDLKDAVKCYEEGVRAGERAIGKRVFKKCVGRFWGLHETRPYMRARLGLAQCLWEGGRREETVEHYQDMLRLNPNDNQGVRTVLAACLLDLGRDDDLQKLLGQYEESCSAAWAYTKALLAFRKERDTENARNLLAEARKTNKHVPDYLLGNKPLPRQLPHYAGFGDENEAICYAGDFLTGWRATPGALSWLRKVAKVRPPGKPRSPKRSSRTVDDSISQLPQIHGEVWQVDSLRLPKPVKIGSETMQPWAILIANCSDSEIVALDVAEKRPSDAVLWGKLLHAMRNPTNGEPHRPEQIQVRTKKRCEAWRADLENLNIKCVFTEQLDFLDYVLQEARNLLPGLRSPDEDVDSSSRACDLTELPQNVGEQWQADVQQMPAWIEGKDGGPVRPWCIMVTDRTNDLILACDLEEDHPDLDVLWEKLAQAMKSPIVRNPHRPGQVQVRSQDHRNGLEPHLEAVGVGCVVSDELDQLDAAFEGMTQHVADEPPAMSALVEVPGVRPEQVGSYFEAAAHFYQKEPWREIPGDAPIKVECNKFQSGPWYAFVMGQSGMTLGLALYDDLDAIQAMIGGDSSDQENARRTSALSMTFDEEFNLAPADLDAAEQFGWPVAAPEAYPCAMRVNPGPTVRSPLAWELELLEGCLRTIPDFLARDDVDSERFVVPVASGKLELVLSWVDEDEK